MSNAEKFIEENTRNCSNEILRNKNESFTNIPCKGEYNAWITPDQALRAVEIAREEVIEKVCEFLDNVLCCYINAQDFAIEHQRLKNNLMQAMKDKT